jgi:two-component system, OmpR family, sensor histidine kinase BaeS
MGINRLWFKMAAVSAGTAVIGVLAAALLIRNATASEFGSYLEHIGRMNGMGGMMGGNFGGMMGQPETAFLASVNSSLWIAGGMAVAIAALVAIVFSRQITAPLRRLSTAVGRVAQGDTSCRLPATSTDEVGALTSNFNCMVESLDRNQDARRKLMGDLAHEMGTPLSVIQSNLEGMLDGVVEASPEKISSMHQEAMLLARLVKDLRTLSQAEAGRLNLAPAPGDLGRLVSSIVTAAGPEAARKGVALSVHVGLDLPPAMMDEDRVSQIVVNLLSNALRYTSAGDTVKVGVAAEEEGRQLVVSVADTGQGIPEADLPYIFDRYYRGPEPKEKRAGGSGIGLAVVKELVEAQGGRVRARSVPGRGSTFFFTLPAVTSA